MTTIASITGPVTVQNGFGGPSRTAAEIAQIEASATATTAAIVAAATDDIADVVAEAQNAALIRFESWTLLNANPGAVNGQGATVHGPDTGTHTDPVVGGTVNNTGLYRWSTSPAGWKWLSHLQSTYVVDLFPAGHDAVLDKITWLRIYNGNPLKFYRVAYFFYRDIGTRFTISISQADDEAGTNSSAVCTRVVSSGASYSGLNKLTIPEAGGSGITAEFIADFGNGTTAFNAPYDATYAQAGLPPDICLPHDTDYVVDLITETLEPLLPSATGQRKPFLDDHDSDASVIFPSALLRSFVKNVWVYGPDRASNVRIEYMRLSEAATSFIHLYDEDRGRRICSWAESATSSFASKPRYVEARTIPNLLVYSGDWAVLELDWSVLTENIEGSLSSMTISGLHPDCLNSWEASTWWAENPVFHETVPVGASRTYTTLALAIAGLDRPSHPHHSILLKLDEAATDYEADGLVLPQFVSIQGPGMHAVAGISNANTATTNPVLERHTSSHIWDVRIQSNSGDGTAGSGEYCIHHDPVRNDCWGSDGGGQRWGVMGSMKNVMLVGSANNDANLFGGGFNSGMIELWDNVKSKRLHPNPSSADFSAHDTAPEPTSAGIYAPNSQQLKPITWRIRDSASPAMVQSSLQVISLNSGALTTGLAKNQLVLSGCSFRLVTQTVTVGTAYRWEMSGTHAGAIVQTSGTGEVYPDLGNLRAARNSTGSSIATGRAVKFGSTNTITLCGAGERIDGWTTTAIANGASGFVNVGKSIATQYLDGAAASTGEWGLNASGQIDYAAATKLGRTSGNIVTVW